MSGRERKKLAALVRAHIKVERSEYTSAGVPCVAYDVTCLGFTDHLELAGRDMSRAEIVACMVEIIRNAARRHERRKLDAYAAELIEMAKSDVAKMETAEGANR